jgi:Uma2 family endonuclease
MLQGTPQQAAPRRPRVIYDVPEPAARADWMLSEDSVPESRPHDLVVDRVRALLTAWAQRISLRAAICRNLAVRWKEETPAIGVDPDVCVLAPPPPEGDALPSLRLWQPGHVPPVLAVEIVSASRADKDYTQSPDKYAANGTGELWVFDPMLAGPKTQGGPFRIQVWRRNDEGDFRRVYSGEGPAWSEAVRGFLHAVDGGSELAICDDVQGTRRWLTAEEAERAAKETERAAKEAERAAKEEAQRRAERLAEKLRALGVDPDELG